MENLTLKKALIFTGLTFLILTILILCEVDVSKKLPWGGVILAGIISLTAILRKIFKM